jgi:transcription elongation factor GreA
MTQPAYLTKEGLERLTEERDHLFTVRRHDVAERIQRAKEMGGTVDNAEYEEAKNDQAYIEGRILTLDSLIRNARIIEKDTSSDVVHIGSTVQVEDSRGRKSKYKIIGSAEADPSQGSISNVSPIGKALLGKRAGDVADVAVPAGQIQLKVLSIS